MECSYGKLKCDQDIYEVGDRITVTSQLSQEDFAGTISSVTTDVVHLILSTGLKVRVHLAHLRTNRCFLSLSKNMKNPLDYIES